jgi:hypothetical protein
MTGINDLERIRTLARYMKKKYSAEVLPKPAARKELLVGFVELNRLLSSGELPSLSVFDIATYLVTSESELKESA